jgi:hypothetical protein
MSFSVTCQACDARLKLPPGTTKKKARCPKCSARIDLTANLNATAYMPTIAKPVKPTKSSIAEAAPVASPPKPPPLPEREEDPLPYLDLIPAPRKSVPPSLPTTKPTDEAPLSLDDPAPAPVGPPPFRTPARVTSDSAKQFSGLCDLVLVPHGLFLEAVPRPFLYAPLGSRVFAPARETLVLTLPDGRTVAIELLGRHAARVTDDTAAFMAGERGVPDSREYRRSPSWLLWIALIFALGVSIGPIVMSQTTDLSLETGLWLGAGFAVVGLVANAVVVSFTRMSVVGKFAVMTLIAAAITGVFLFVATAYLAGKHEAPTPNPVEPQPPTPPAPKPPEPNPVLGAGPGVDPPRRNLPTAIDAAYQDGMFRFEDGPDDVTAVATTPDGSALIVGYKNGNTRIWRFDQPAIEPSSPGPKADGAPTHIQFDGTGAIVYMSCTTGTVAALWNDPPESPVKIPGEPLAVFAFPSGERFAAHRGNGIILRYVPTNMVKKPMAKAKGFVVTAAKDEVVPADVKAPIGSPQKPTFLAWHPTGKLLGGQADGTILNWGATGPGAAAIREHKAAVRAWAASPSTWDFATGDDKGIVGLWANKSMTPKTFTAASAAITHLSFSPSGSHLAILDSTGTVWVWDLFAMRSNLKATRPTPVKSLAFGTQDDLLLLSAGKGVEMWHIPELAKQP